MQIETDDLVQCLKNQRNAAIDEAANWCAIAQNQARQIETLTKQLADEIAKGSHGPAAEDSV